MIALPRPPPASRIEGEKGDEDMVIGPPPQAALKQPDGSDKEFDEDSPEDSHRIVLSNEIVLRGHTKQVQGWKANNSPSSSRSRHHFKQLPLKEAKMRLCWADLPSDLLANISEKASTTNTQYVHLRAVCKAWRSALTPHPHHLPPQLPWLMLPRFFNDIRWRLDISDHISFYDIAQSKTYRFQLPYMRGKYCRGSSHGWFVLQHEDERQVSLFNPVTSRYIDLPSLDAPSTLGWRIHIRKSCLSCTPSKPGCVVVALLSSPNGQLCFCQIGDSHWSELKKRDVGSWLVDFTIYNNLVYTVNSKKFISVCDLKDRSVWTFPSKINFYIPRNDQINLVEGDVNSSGPLVVRTFDYKYSGNIRVHAYKWCDVRQVWRRVRDIGKRVLFLNKMCSVNVQCDEKQESGVYYNVKQHSGNIESFRVGIHRANLEYGKEVPDMPSPMDVFPSICGSPLWVTPSLIWLS